MDTTTIAAVLLVLIVFVDRTLNILKSRGIDLQKIARQVDRLYEWHDVSDSDNVKVWYVRHSLEKAISDLTRSIKEQTEFLKNIDNRLDRLEKV